MKLTPPRHAVRHDARPRGGAVRRPEPLRRGRTAGVYDETLDPSQDITGKEATSGKYERAISIFRCAYTWVSQSRADAPGLGLIWFGQYAPHCVVARARARERARCRRRLRAATCARSTGRCAGRRRSSGTGPRASGCMRAPT